MSGRNTGQVGPALVLALVLAVTGARSGAAAGSHAGSLVARTQESGLFERVWDWLLGSWIGQDAGGGQGLARIWGEEGPGMDPNGKSRTGSSGACGAAVCTDAGPGMDPNGKARTGSRGACGAAVCTDAGFGMDPDGSH